MLKTTKNAFLYKAISKYQDHYDYTNIDFKDMDTPITIHCNIHNCEYTQTPRQHLKSEGCSACCKERALLPFSIFVKRAKAKHNGKYSYDHAVYLGSKVPIKITCPVHGDFLQKPTDHLKGNGCQRCGRKKQRRTFLKDVEWFKNKIKTIDTGLSTPVYDTYKNTRDKMDFICAKHGRYQQWVYHFLAGTQCPKCGIERRADAARTGTAEFIRRANKVHQNKYNYDKVVYRTTGEKVCITCPIHGDFWQTPDNHVIQKQGCPVCGKEKKYRIESLGIDGFIKKARAVHGNKYDYDSVTNYTNNKNKVCITCPIHGAFWQRPDQHLRGAGCPKCASSKGEQAIANILAKMGLAFEAQFQIPGNSFRYDFFIPSLKLIIEYHGKQHFIPLDRFGGEKGLEEIRARDEIKRSLVLSHGYIYESIGYYRFSDIEKALIEVITNHYKYVYHDIFYSSFQTLIIGANLPVATTVADVKKYLARSYLESKLS